MGTRYTKKNLGDPNWSKPNNYKIKQNDAIYDVEIVPNKGVKGDISAQPFNDQNAEDIENALVSLDDDLAFIEADYINNAEHALKQDVTDNDLNTTDKTVVGAINEVKSEGEYHDLLQDDAIAIVNNKINALPMNGSLKNIRTSLVGIPTTYTNIDMFNTKQTVTNYQPLSLDYKGATEPHIILMKTIGDYTFDFAVEATHTNGTDTTIILEAWVDGVLYDTATRTLVGGSNQINGVTGFFTYSKGTDTVPSEIYFRFRASQGNTSANKTLINTTLFGNSAESSFTDTDHVTGINLNEPTYNGATTSFIINDLDARTGQQTSDANGTTFSNGVVLTKVQAALPGDISNHLSIYDNTNGIGFSNNAMTYVSHFSAHKFTNPSSVVYAVIKDVIDEPKSLITKEYADNNYMGIEQKELWSLDELGLDGTWVLDDVPGNIKKAYDKVVSLIGNQTTFTITQGLLLDPTAPHYEFAVSIYNDIATDTGKTLDVPTFEWSLTFSTYSGNTNIDANTSNFMQVKTQTQEHYKHFDYDNWSDRIWFNNSGVNRDVITNQFNLPNIATNNVIKFYPERVLEKGWSVEIGGSGSISPNQTTSFSSASLEMWGDVDKNQVYSWGGHHSAVDFDTQTFTNVFITSNYSPFAYLALVQNGTYGFKAIIRNESNNTILETSGGDTLYAGASGNVFNSMGYWQTNNAVGTLAGFQLNFDVRINNVYGYVRIWDKDGFEVPFTYVESPGLFQGFNVGDNMERPEVGDNMQDPSILKEVISND